MRKDGELRPLFRRNLPKYQWTSVETAGTSSGVPDSEFMTPEGIQGWLEFKFTKIFFVEVKPLQAAWLARRCRMGGNAWIAVRRIPVAKIYEGVDELYLMRGDQAEALLRYGLTGIYGEKWDGGPSNWNWSEINKALNLGRNRV
jgi:hypothetical protein